MGEAGDVFRLLTQLKKERKINNQNRNLDVINSSGIEYRTDENGTILIKTKIGTVCFYPTTNKFMVKGKVYYGNAKSCLGFIKNRDV